MFVGLPAAYVLHLGGVAQILEDRIAAVSGAAKVTVEGASLAFRSGAMPVYIHATNIGMRLDDADLLIPEADIAFGVNSLITGVPSEVAISGLEVAIIRSPMAGPRRRWRCFSMKACRDCRSQMVEMTVAAISRPADLNV